MNQELELKTGAFAGTKFSDAIIEYNIRRGIVAVENPAIHKALFIDGTQRIAYASYFSQVELISVSSDSTSLFATDASIAIGVTNLAKGEPPANELFLVTAIQFLYASSAYPKKADYTLLSDLMRSGEMEISQRGRTIFPRQQMECFNTESVNNSALALGTVAIAPVFLQSLENIKVEMMFSEACGATDSVKLRLIGAKNVRI
jgi:hypothetical protein